MTENQKQLKIAFVTTYDNIRGYKEQEIWSGSRLYKESKNLISNEKFEAELVYDGFLKGRSAFNIRWIDHQRKKIYYSGMSLLDEALNLGIVNGSRITGAFCFKKQGTSILLQQV